MSWMLDKLGIVMAVLIRYCYGLCHDYVAAIALFTCLTKVTLFPLSIWVQKSSLAMVGMMPELNRLRMRFFGDKDRISEATQRLYRENHYHPLVNSIPMLVQIVILIGVVDAVKKLLGESTGFLTLIPASTGGLTLLIPIMAGLSAFCLGVAQNSINPLQREQSKKEQRVTNGISIAVSLVLGTFVSVGTCVYWIASNLSAIVVQMILNEVIPPENYIDYMALAESREELERLNALNGQATKNALEREKKSYKHSFSIANKHLVFYSEKSGFYKYFQRIIEYILTNSNVIVHYVTSDPEDQIFELAKEQPRIRPYYIGEKRLITLMMKMDADMVVMTTPDLDNFYLKRSYIRKDIEYVYLDHAIGSTTMAANKGAFDHFDTFLCTGPYEIAELRETEAKYGLKPKNLIPCGYGELDNLKEAVGRMDGDREEGALRVLIAPSWQQDNILDSCAVELVQSIYAEGFHVTVRPHPEYVKRYPARIADLKKLFSEYAPDHFMLEEDFSSSESVYRADMLITDWSGICFEYALSTKRPVLFINTPIKVLNPDYLSYQNEPIEISLRDRIGRSLELGEVGEKAGTVVSDMLKLRDSSSKQIEETLQQTIYNVGHSGEAGGKYILSRLIARKQEK